MFDKVPASKWLEILYDLKKDISPNILKENDPYEAWVVTERGFCFVSRNGFAVYATLKLVFFGNIVSLLRQFDRAIINLIFGTLQATGRITIGLFFPRQAIRRSTIIAPMVCKYL